MDEDFKNETLDLRELPKYENVTFTPLHPNFGKVVLINAALFSLILAIGVTVFLVFMEEWRPYALYCILGAIVLIFLIFFFGYLSFKKKGFAVREHDILFQHGIIAHVTTIVPFNRIQHVALHQGWVSRIFNLAQIEVYTAGGDNSDMKIDGIDKELAENVKQLLMQKIQNKI